MKSPNLTTLDPPAQPGELIAWCPLCGDVITRRLRDVLSSRDRILAEEAGAVEHMRDRHGLTADEAIAAVTEAMRDEG